MDSKRFRELQLQAPAKDHIDALSKQGIELVSVVETLDGADSTRLSRDGGNLRFAVINNSHRSTVVVDFEACPTVRLVTVNEKDDRAICQIKAQGRLNRNVNPRVHSAVVRLAVVPTWDGSGQQDETIETEPRVAKVKTNGQFSSTSPWQILENTFDLDPGWGNNDPDSRVHSGGSRRMAFEESMLPNDPVLSAALSVLFNEAWKFVKGIFKGKAEGQDSPRRIRVADREIDLTASAGEFAKLIDNEVYRMVQMKITSKTQSLTHAFSRATDLERQLENQPADEESPWLKEKLAREIQKVEKIATDLKDLLEQVARGEITVL